MDPKRHWLKQSHGKEYSMRKAIIESAVKNSEHDKTIHPVII